MWKKLSRYKIVEHALVVLLRLLNFPLGKQRLQHFPFELNQNLLNRIASLLWITNMAHLLSFWLRSLFKNCKLGFLFPLGWVLVTLANSV